MTLQRKREILREAKRIRDEARFARMCARAAIRDDDMDAASDRPGRPGARRTFFDGIKAVEEVHVGTSASNQDEVTISIVMNRFDKSSRWAVHEAMGRMYRAFGDVLFNCTVIDAS